jgi:hypothetical protein
VKDQKTLVEQWRGAFFTALESHDTGARLREAAVVGALGAWTECLTAAVVSVCGAMGWRAAGRGHLGDVLPVSRSEYLALDIVAFAANAASRWPLPIAAFELENSPTLERVAYSLWKVLCVRAALRMVFAYRRDTSEASALVALLTDTVIAGLSFDDRLALGGETCLIVGNRGEAGTFPYGYFKVWVLDPNTGRFART